MDYIRIIKECIDESNNLNNYNCEIKNDILIEGMGLFKELSTKTGLAESDIEKIILSTSKVDLPLRISISKNDHGYLMNYLNSKKNNTSISFFKTKDDLLNILILEEVKPPKISVAKLYKKILNNADSKFVLDEVIFSKNNNVVKRKINFSLNEINAKIEDYLYNIIFQSKEEICSDEINILSEENYLLSALLEIDLQLFPKDINDLMELLCPKLYNKNEHIFISTYDKITGTSENFSKECIEDTCKIKFKND